MVPKGPLKINGPIWANTKKPNKTKDILVISQNTTCKTLAYMNPRKPHSFCDLLSLRPHSYFIQAPQTLSSTTRDPKDASKARSHIGSGCVRLSHRR